MEGTQIQCSEDEVDIGRSPVLLLSHARRKRGHQKGQSLKEENQDGAREGALRWGFISESAD